MQNSPKSMYNPGIAGVIFIPSAEETNTCIQSESINKEKLCQSAFNCSYFSFTNRCDVQN